MGGQSGEGEGSARGGQGTPQGEDAGLLDTTVPGQVELPLPRQSPLYHAEHAGRYERQELIKLYQDMFDCRLIVVCDLIFPDSIVVLEELLYDADPARPMHLMLDSPGGDGETAVRMVRSAQARTSELTVIVPNQAKSAATILAMGAHRILMGPTSDLGPVDPQFQVGEGNNRTLVSAKDIIAAVDSAEKAIAANPDTYTLHASLLTEVDALKVQQARSALARTDDLVEEALRSHPGRSEEDVAALKKKLKKPLIDLPKDHGAVFGAADAKRHGLPVEIVDPRSDQWKLIWRLYSKYVVLGPHVRIYEGQLASQVFRA